VEHPALSWCGVTAMPRAIVLAEDEDQFAEWAVNALQGAGLPEFDILRSTTIEDTIRLCQAKPPDLLILDLRLRGLSGMTTYPTVRKACPDVPILVCSALIDSQEGSQLIYEGASGAYVKPSAALPEPMARQYFREAVLFAFAQAKTREDLRAEGHQGVDVVLKRRVEIVEIRISELDARMDEQFKTLEQRLERDEEKRDQQAEDIKKKIDEKSLQLAEQIAGLKATHQLRVAIISTVSTIGAVIAAAWAAKWWK
jgi:DNA-binding NarL/FixJ family response regulator